MARFLLIVLAALAVGACGGGGDGPPDTGDGGGSGGGPGAGGGAGNGPGGSPPALHQLMLTADNAVDATRLPLFMADVLIGYAQIGAALADFYWGVKLPEGSEYARVFGCVQGGNETVRMNDAAEDGFGPGDSLIVTLNGCADAGLVMSGAMTVTAYGRTQSSDLDYGYSLRVHIEHLRIDFGAEHIVVGLTLLVDSSHSSSDARFVIDGARVRIESSDSSDELTGVLIDYRQDSIGRTYEWSFSGRFSGQEAGGWLDVVTLEPLVGAFSGNPTGGRLLLAGAQGTYVRWAPYSVGSQTGVRIGLYVDVLDSPTLEWTLGWHQSTAGVLPDGLPGGAPGWLAGRKIPLGAYGAGMVLDESRGYLYVTVPDRNEVVVLSVHTLEVIERMVVGSAPSGIALGADGDTLYLGNGASGEVTTINLQTREVFVHPVRAALDHWQATWLAEFVPGAVVVFPGDGGYAASLDIGSGVARRVADGSATSAISQVLGSADSRFVYFVQEGRLFVLDAGADGLPVLAEGPWVGSGRVALSGDERRLVTGDGTVLQTDTLEEEAYLPLPSLSGRPAFTRDDSELWIATDHGRLRTYDAETLEFAGHWRSDCGFATPRQLLHLGGQRWALMDGDEVCVVDTGFRELPPGVADVPPPAGPVVSFVGGVQAGLGHVGFDAVAERERAIVYVSVPALDEIVILSTDHGAELGRIGVYGGPHGLAMSSDGATLYAALHALGAVAFIDTGSWTVTAVIDVSEALGDWRAWNVAESAPGVLFVSANPWNQTQGHIARLDRNAGNAVSRVSEGRVLRYPSSFAVSPDGQTLYVADMTVGSGVFSVDATSPSAPVLAVHAHGPVQGHGPMVLSPDGSRLFLASGQVLDAQTLYTAGLLQSGVPMIASEEQVVVTASGRYLHGYTLATGVKVTEFVTDCALGSVSRFIAAGQSWLILGHDQVCLVPAPGN